MLQRNYHTHTYRCKHATGDVIDYAKAAIEADLTTLGMSEGRFRKISEEF